MSEASTVPIRNLVSLIGLFVAAVTALSAPIAYGLISAGHEADRLSFAADLNASRVSRYIYQYGSMWPFHRVRLAELIELSENEHGKLRQRVLTSDGKLVLEEGAELRRPVLSRSAPIVVGATTTGLMEVQSSARPLLIKTAFVALFSFSLGAIALFALRFLPLRVLDRTMLQLSDREREIRDKNAQLDSALTSMIQGLCLFDAEGKLAVVNERFAALFELAPGTVLPGNTLEQIVRAMLRSGSLTRADAEDIFAQTVELVRSREPASCIWELRNGRTFAVSIEPTENGGWVATYEEVTERRRNESQIAHMAHHDALTGLPNRVRFRNVLEAALKDPTRSGSLAVLCLDLDHFKPVNDTLGHSIGDALLKAVSERLRALVKDNETCVGRLGGDEFAFLQIGVEQPVSSTELAARLIASISEPYEAEGHRMVIGTSVGIAVSPMDGDEADQLLKNADLALYRAKEDGRERYRFFEPEMDHKMQARRSLELDLRNALAVGEFQVFYQPLINLQDNVVSGFEALLRWHHPVRGVVSPAEFIPLAEDIGLINGIGAWVLRQACSDAVHWPSDIKVAVNLSPVQFKNGTLLLDVAAALGNSGLRPNRLELEITEGVLLQCGEGTMAILDQLHGLGINISMDDFGTGYSSLSYLRQFPFDKIKIDRAFIRDLADTDDTLAVVRAVSGLGRSLGMSTTAEGVETLDQLRQVRAEGCTEAQGYLFSEARPASDVWSMIERLDDSLRAAA